MMFCSKPRRHHGASRSIKRASRASRAAHTSSSVSLTVSASGVPVTVLPGEMMRRRKMVMVMMMAGTHLRHKPHTQREANARARGCETSDELLQNSEEKDKQKRTQCKRRQMQDRSPRPQSITCGETGRLRRRGGKPAQQADDSSAATTVVVAQTDAKEPKTKQRDSRR